MLYSIKAVKEKRMVNESDFIKRLALKGNPRWTKEGWEKEGWAEGKSKWNLQEAKEVFDAFVDTMMECLAEGEDVKLKGFGKFEIRTTKARLSMGFDKDEISIRPHKRVHFTQSKILKQLVDTPDVGGEE